MKNNFLMKKQKLLIASKKIITILLISISLGIQAQTLEQTALNKQAELEALITTAQSQGIDVYKEQTAVKTVDLFLFYADWDEANKSANTTYFTDRMPLPKDEIGSYTASQLADYLPDFEREEVIEMLDESIAYLQKLINGEEVRTPTRIVDLSNTHIQRNTTVQNGEPIFINTYTWQGAPSYLEPYLPNLGSGYYDPASLEQVSGVVQLKAGVRTTLESAAATGKFGAPFLGQTNVPGYLSSAYPDLVDGYSHGFTRFDVDHPQAREMHRDLFSEVVPIFKDKISRELGYMLTNEPHFHTAENSWDYYPISNYTKDKFVLWLSDKYGNNINNLQAVWSSNPSSFQAAVDNMGLPLPYSRQGDPEWYDWVKFNQERITDWFIFLRDEIQSHDAEAKVHVKVIPGMWVGNTRDHGLDFEAIAELSQVLGNDAKAYNSQSWGAAEDWESKYALRWDNISIPYDFFSSVNPDAINYNSETHFLSSGSHRDLFMKPSYARLSHWLGTIQGMDVSTNWFWGRNADGSPKSNAYTGYPGSVLQQPRIFHEIQSTMIDINAFGAEIDALQKIRKPMRLFYSETSAINSLDASANANYMTKLNAVYESLYFEGFALGFATQRIIEKQNSNNWDVIVVAETEFVTDAEFSALQSYLNGGGTVITDGNSLTKDEYGRTRSQSLTSGSGTLINTSLTNLKNQVLSNLSSKSIQPPVIVNETNPLGGNIKGCINRSVIVDGRTVANLLNISKEPIQITLSLASGVSNFETVNLLNGKTIGNSFTMQPEDVLLVELKSGVVSEPIPSPWMTSDIGAVAAAGSASYSNGSFTVNGSGADIWGAADEFRYVYQSYSQDVEITAKVNSLSNTNAWAKAGVMIRSNLNAGSAHAMTVITPSNGVNLQYRTAENGTSGYAQVTGQTVPTWVRVRKEGNTITSYYSSNGSTWNQIGTATTISFGSGFYIGLCVTSHKDGTISTADISNVEVQALNGNINVTSVSLSPASQTLTSAGETVQLAATILPANATNQSLSWSSSAPAVASVNNGVVTAVANGTTIITASSVDGPAGTSTITVDIPTTTVQTPYGGSSRAIPGIIEAEEYDNGGEGVAYHDNDANNAGANVMREEEGVDIEARDGGNSVGWTVAGEWMEYTVNATAGTYEMQARVAAVAAGKTITVKLDGLTLGVINVPNTGNWGTFQTVSIPNIAIASGSGKILRIELTTGAANLNWIDFIPTTTDVPVTGISVGPTSLSIAEGETGNLSETVIPGDATNQAVSWSSNNTSVATVNASGVVSGVAVGTATITVTTNDGGYTATSAITVTGGGTEPTTVTLSPIHDAYLQGSTNYNNTLIRIEAGNRVGYLMYDLSSINGAITAAELQLTCTGDAGNGNIDINLGNGTSWTESNLSTSNAPSTGTLLGNLNSSYSIGNAYTASLSAASISGGGNISIVLTHTGGNDVAFASKENSATGPQLVLTYDAPKSAEESIAMEENTHVEIYPNPATDELNIAISNFDGIASVTIINSIGTVVYSGEYTKDESLQLSELNQGIYILNVNVNNTMITKMFVKQ